MRYTYFASVAKKEGYEQISAIFTETADQEKEHAKKFFKYLEGGCLSITARFPAGVIGTTEDLMKSKGADPANIVATLGPRFCGDCYEVGDEIADQFIKRFPLTKTKTRFGGAGIDIAEAAMIDLAFAGVHQVVDSMPRVHAATQYLEEDPELAELCRTDGEGPAELAERIDNISHSMCTLENPLWYSHRRAALANKTHEGRLLALIVRD